jgi:hypothetical protein
MQQQQQRRFRQWPRQTTGCLSCADAVLLLFVQASSDCSTQRVCAGTGEARTSARVAIPRTRDAGMGGMLFSRIAETIACVGRGVVCLYTDT